MKMTSSRMICAAALVAGASAFSPLSAGRAYSSTALFNLEKGAGGMFDTRNPDAVEHEDSRKSISQAPSFEEYMKQRGRGGGGTPVTASVAPPAPAPAWGQPAAYRACCWFILRTSMLR
jgi:hypothetical protein